MMVGLDGFRKTNPELWKQSAEQIYDNALIAAGLLEDPQAMLKRMNALLEQVVKNLGLRRGRPRPSNHVEVLLGKRNPGIVFIARTVPADDVERGLKFSQRPFELTPVGSFGHIHLLAERSRPDGIQLDQTIELPREGAAVAQRAVMLRIVIFA